MSTEKKFASHADLEEKQVSFHQLSEHAWAYTAEPGRKAQVLRAWQPDARPVPCLLDELAATVEPAGASRLLIDVAGPASFVIEGEPLAHLADGNALVELDTGEFAWIKAEEPVAH